MIMSKLSGVIQYEKSSHFSGCLCVLGAMSGCRKTQSEPGQYLYATVLHNSGEDESTAKYLEIAGRSQELLPLLEEKAGVFVVNAYNFQDLDGEGTPLYTMNGMELPEEIDPNGRCMCVDENYLTLNGIQAADGGPLAGLLVHDDLTQNLLVPEQFRDREADIIKAYRARFYFEKVTAENNYSEDAGLSGRLALSEDDLTINLIYVKDGQRWPVYREDVVSEGGYITDPIVQVYTGNIHCNYAHSILSQWTYFYSGEADPDKAYEALRPYVEQCGAGESLRSVELVG